MADKKKKDYFPDFEYRYFSIEFKETEMEGIQGPVYRPSGQVMDLGETKTIEMNETTAEVFHDGEAKVYELGTDEFSLEEEKVSKEPIPVGFIPCPNCDSPIPIMSEKRPLKIKCPSCGKSGKLED
ncbi:MAG: hypothetical protein U9R75_08055 [Candidatus Thermoplasmatota archaeon]|nr:hypothetical protein [Candidatus Thermoplasmatota archaeon]